MSITSNLSNMKILNFSDVNLNEWLIQASSVSLRQCWDWNSVSVRKLHWRLPQNRMLCSDATDAWWCFELLLEFRNVALRHRLGWRPNRSFGLFNTKLQKRTFVLGWWAKGSARQHLVQLRLRPNSCDCWARLAHDCRSKVRRLSQRHKLRLRRIKVLSSVQSWWPCLHRRAKFCLWICGMKILNKMFVNDW